MRAILNMASATISDKIGMVGDTTRRAGPGDGGMAGFAIIRGLRVIRSFTTGNDTIVTIYAITVDLRMINLGRPPVAGEFIVAIFAVITGIYVRVVFSGCGATIVAIITPSGKRSVIRYRVQAQVVPASG